MNDSFSYIIENVQLDLETGPYITGSKLTHMVEKLFRTPNYQPKDIDVLCRNEDQRIVLEKTLKKYYFFSDKSLIKTFTTPWRIVKEERMTVYKYKCRASRYGSIDIIVSDVSAQERLDYHDLIICKIACCNTKTLAHKNCFSDIKNKNLNVDFNNLCNQNSLKKLWIESGLLSRLDKYKKRAYNLGPELLDYFKKFEI
jgi:hypothetical protein